MSSFRCLASALLLQAMAVCAGAAPLSDSAAVSWKQDFTLTERMKVYDFPEEQISYPVTIPAGVKPESLKLLAFTGQTARQIPFQLTDAGGQTKVCFRTDLPQGATRRFQLVSGSVAPGISVIAPPPPTLQTTGDPHEATLANGLLLVKVPAGHQDFAGGKPLAEVAAPILALARRAQPQPWMATGSFSAPTALRVDSMDAKVVESGPLFTLYQVTYKLEGNKSYTATLELRANEWYLRVAERVSGFTPSDQTFLQLNYGKGLLDPDRCLVGGNGGYVSESHPVYSGGYDDHISTNCKFVPWGSTVGWWEYDPKKDDSQDPRLAYCLGLYAPNAIAVMHATAFYREQGTDALVLVLNRLAEWKTYERSIWTSVRDTENLRFYSRPQDGQKYMTAGLAGQQRFWAAGLLPRSEIKIPLPVGVQPRKKNAAEGTDDEPEATADKSVPPWRKPLVQAGMGPEGKLFNQLNDWSLNAYKDRAVDWPETMSGAPFNDPHFYPMARAKKGAPPARSYEEFDPKLGAQSGLFRDIVRYSWDFGVGGINFREMPTSFGVYAMSRANWTQAQRDRERQVLLFLADATEGDCIEPHHSMLAGHPNFVMDIKTTLPVACATFPNHPHAKLWRDSFMSFYNEWLDTFDRKDVPELNTRGGRWTENIACYLGTCIYAMDAAQQCLMAYDGTSLGKNPQLFVMLRWVRDAFTSPHNGVRMIPPQGAHSGTAAPGGKLVEGLFKFCALMGADDPKFAAEMRWIETNGKEGQKPDLHSALYTDYGPVFRYDFGGAHESYAHMQNISGFLRYRWGRAGIVYYGAKNKVWSYNADETNGDKFDWNQVTAFNVGGKGMDGCPTDQLLYDFDFAQFYRQGTETGSDPIAGTAQTVLRTTGSDPVPVPYRARGVMLLRDDYLVLADEVQDATTAGTFNWVTLFEPPQIYQLKPGAPLQPRTTSDARGEHRTGKVFSYSGKGDFLTVVAPAAVKAEATAFGASVNGEYVFASQKPEEVSQGGALFSGTYGYARPNQLALFQGTRIGLNGFELRREGGDFGVSAAVEANHVIGRIVGRSGGKVFVTPPPGMNPAAAAVTVNGKAVAHTLEQGAVAFSVEIAQREGLKNYEIQFGK